MVSDNTLHINVFFSIPDDLQKEWEEAEKLIRDVAARHPEIRDKVEFRWHSWDFEEVKGSVRKARKSIREARKWEKIRPANSDVYVMAVWTQLSDKLPDDLPPGEAHEIMSESGRTVQFGTVWEFESAKKAFQEKDNPNVFLYWCTNTLGKANTPGYKERRDGQQKVEKFIETLTNPDGSIRQNPLTYDYPNEFIDDLETRLINVAAELLAETGNALSASKIALTINPFPGLHAFNYDMSDYFFGRDEETAYYIKQFNQSRFLLITGGSGSGKSSLVWAGMLPKLPEWIHTRLTPGKEPIRSLAEALLSRPQVATHYDLNNDKSDTDNYEDSVTDLVDKLTTGAASLAELAEVILADQGPQMKWVLFIDQFEELFTLQERASTEDAKIRNEARLGTFLRILDQAADVERIGIIATLRADLFDETYQRLEIPTLFGNTIHNLRKPDDNQILQMIIGPMKKAGIHFEEGLPTTILSDSEGSIALIAYMMEQLYKRCEATRSFTMNDYEELGRIKGIISKRVEEALNAPALRNKGSEQLDHSLEKLFANLTTVTEEMRPASRSAMLSTGGDDPLMGEIVRQLERARLLTRDKDGIRLATDKLFQGWTRLAEWVPKHKDHYYTLNQVEFAAKAWKEALGKADTPEKKLKIDKQYLWPQERLDPVQQAIDDLHIEVQEPISEFIRPEAERLLKEIEDPATSHSRRAWIGDRLLELGDHRPGIGLDDNGLPLFDWCNVSGSRVRISQKGGEWTYPEDYKFQVQDFAMSRYMVTFKQYEAFLNAEDGYNSDEWWNRESDLVKTSAEEQSEQTWRSGNRPTENVSWYEAVAFCRWYQRHCPPPEGYVYRLPTVGEWVLAANVQDDPMHGFPWGNEWDSSCANTFDSRLNLTIAVGMYPFADAVHGDCRISDLMGNLYDWCMNDSKTFNTQVHKEKDRYRFVVGNCWRCGDTEVTQYRYFADRPAAPSRFYGFRLVMGRPSEK